jgi:hypothetical protein
MNIEALTAVATAAVHQAEQLLEAENIRQFQAFFKQIETGNDIKKLVPKTISFAMPVTDASTGVISTQQLELPLISLVPMQFLTIENVALSITTKDGNKQVPIACSQTQHALQKVIDDYAARL